MHPGSPNMIIVMGKLTSETIDRSLREIDARGELERCSLVTCSNVKQKSQ
jgi:hypothetical protein